MFCCILFVVVVAAIADTDVVDDGCDIVDDDDGVVAVVGDDVPVVLPTWVVVLNAVLVLGIWEEFKLEFKLELLCKFSICCKPCMGELFD